MDLTEREMSDLIVRYQTSPTSGLIRYSEFVNKLNEVFLETCDKNAVIQNARTTAVSYKNQIRL